MTFLGCLSIGHQYGCLSGQSDLKGAGSFHIHRKTNKELGALLLQGIWERPNLAHNLVTRRHTVKAKGADPTPPSPFLRLPLAFSDENMSGR